MASNSSSMETQQCRAIPWQWIHNEPKSNEQGAVYIQEQPHC